MLLSKSSLHLQRSLLLRPISTSTSSSIRLFSTTTPPHPPAGRTSATLSLPPTSNSKSKPKHMIIDTNPVKGTRDFFPPHLRLRSWLFSKFRSSAQAFNFEEYDTPVLESEDLFLRKGGEEIRDQLYCFTDKGERRVALRPEITPSLARMIMSQGKNVALPIKWYSILQCWRYERMTRGRRREHYQWNCDIWGVSTVHAEAEVLATMVSLFESLELTSDDVGIRVNSRLIIAEILKKYEIPDEKFVSVCILIDKLDKMPVSTLMPSFMNDGLTEDVVTQLISVLKNKDLSSLDSILGTDSPALTQLRQLFELTKAYGIENYITFDASIVRGLSYYTGVVFEAFDKKGELRAIAGGGRYDKLLESFGGESTPAVGFGFGDAVIVELLKERGKLPTFDKGGVDCVIYAIDESLIGPAMKIARELRGSGVSVDLILDGEKKKIKWVFKHSDRIGANYTVVIGSDEWEKGEVVVKGMIDGQQERVKIGDITQWVEKRKMVKERKMEERNEVL